MVLYKTILSFYPKYSAKSFFWPKTSGHKAVAPELLALMWQAEGRRPEEEWRKGVNARGSVASVHRKAMLHTIKVCQVVIPINPC